MRKEVDWRLEAIRAFIDRIQAGVPQTAVRVWLVLWRHADKNGQSFPSVRTVATKVGCRDRTAQRALRWLADAGMITCITRCGRTSVYTVRRPGGDTGDTGDTPQGVTQVTPGGDTGDTGGVTRVTPGGDTAMSPEDDIKMTEEDDKEDLRTQGEPAVSDDASAGSLGVNKTEAHVDPSGAGVQAEEETDVRPWDEAARARAEDARVSAALAELRDRVAQAAGIDRDDVIELAAGGRYLTWDGLEGPELRGVAAAVEAFAKRNGVA